MGELLRFPSASTPEEPETDLHLSDPPAEIYVELLDQRGSLLCAKCGGWESDEINRTQNCKGSSPSKLLTTGRSHHGRHSPVS